MSLLLLVAFVHLMALISPGPDFLFVSQTAVTRTRGTAVCGVLGITIGVTLWALMAMAGWHLVLLHAPWLSRALGIAGGAWLMWMGVQLLQAARRPGQGVGASDATPGTVLQHSKLRDKLRSLTRGLLTNLANPKALVYFGSVFSLIVGGGQSSALRIAILLLIAVETFAWFFLVALVFALPAVRRGYLRGSRFVDAGAGLLFMALGIYLIV